MHQVEHKVQRRPVRRIVFPEGENETVIRAARAIVDQKLARPVLLGRRAAIAETASALGFELPECDIIEIGQSPLVRSYADRLFELRQRKGITPRRARELVTDPIYFGLMMVRMGDADGFIGGMDRAYPETIRPAIQIVGIRDDVSRIAALHLLALRDKVYFFADTMVNIDPTSEELAEIACLAADAARAFDVEPRLAFLAFSSFGSVPHEKSVRVARAVELLRQRRPDLVADGEMHVDTALDVEVAERNYPHSRIKGNANVLIFPDLTSGNIGFKLVQRLGRADVIGPILMGMREPVNVLAHDTDVAQIVNLASITALAADKPARLVAIKDEPVVVI
jgi:malate dehydrogenase (oxaloacetate-decarboxylating)(NADP+)